MPLQLDIQAVSIVLRGHFSPTIFHPSWLASYDLIRRQEADAATIEIIHPNAAIFKVDWLDFRVTEDLFAVTTTQEPYYEALRDLTIGVLEILSYTPINLMGINRDFHYRASSLDVWHSIGHRLAPKRDWEDVLEKPGIRTMTMEGVRPDKLAGYIHAKVEPSAQIQPGIYIQINDHFDFTSNNGPTTGASEATQVLNNHWKDSIPRSLAIAQKIANLEA
jgi:hypothetical protein